MSKTLILFYSLDGSTRKAAQYLSTKLNLPYEEIRPVKKMKAKGFFKYAHGGGQAVMGIKPKLESLKENLENYDTVILGSPVWAGQFAPAIKTLLETGLVHNKKIAFFYCSEGGLGKIEKKIRSSVSLHNVLVSTYSLTNVEDQFERQKKSFLDGIKKII